MIHFKLIKLLIKEKSDEIKTVKNDKKIVNAEKTANTTTRYVPKQLKRDLLKEASYQCQYISPDGRRCSAKTHLEVDHHIVPFCTGGRTIKSNLKILCKQHNLQLAINKLGEKTMRRYLN
ncbi:MAG: HNH endonuclease signature motif containing protein [Bacteriovoracaceae bacterium]